MRTRECRNEKENLKLKMKTEKRSRVAIQKNFEPTRRPLMAPRIAARRQKFSPHPFSIFRAMVTILFS